MAAWISCINHGSDIYRSLISIDMHSRHKKRSWQFVNQFELLMELWINGCKVSFCIFFFWYRCYWFLFQNVFL
uniref:Uncharacterized protein n=1 Tax=Populus trichocarpa TaxID=3694 RepID=A0A2K2BE88_POPTR